MNNVLMQSDLVCRRQRSLIPSQLLPKLICPESVLALFVTLLLPIALFVGGLAPMNRLLYPATAWVLAAWLYQKQSPWYVGLCIWVFCASPLVRRLTDFQAGWDPSNPVLLAPYLACSLTAFSAMDYLRRAWAPFVTTFMLVLGCIGYGFTLAMLNGRALSGAVDAMKWSVGPLFALHLLANQEQRRALSDVTICSLIFAVPLMAAYGIWQFLAPSPWDADWMINAQSLGLNSIGQPEPFSLRVFGTMNSPGSLAAILMFATFVLLGQPIPIALPGLVFVLSALTLTQYRAVWFGTLVGVFLLLRSRRAMAGVALVAMALVGLASMQTLTPQIEQAFLQRLQTLYDLGADASGADRRHQYEVFLSSDHLVGEGLAINGSTRRLDHDKTVVIDSGIIEVISALGLFIGTLFFGCVITLAVGVFTGNHQDLYLVHIYRAGIVATIVQLPFGSVENAESGFLFWVFLGLAGSAAAIPRTHEAFMLSVLPHD